MRLTNEYGVIPIIEPADGQNGVDGDSFQLANGYHAAILLTFGTVTGDSVLKVYSGATSGAKTTALTFTYRRSGADVGDPGSDQYGTETTSAALTLTAATNDHRTLVIDIDAVELPEGHSWLTVEIDNGASALFVAGIAILMAVRYQPPTTAVATA